MKTALDAIKDLKGDLVNSYRGDFVPYLIEYQGYEHLAFNKTSGEYLVSKSAEYCEHYDLVCGIAKFESTVSEMSQGIY